MVGMVPYRQLAVADPLARALELAGYTGAGWVVSVGAVVSMAAVLLVFQYGQPRIFFAMGKDGLMPPWAAAIHPRFRTPHITTLLTGAIVMVFCSTFFISSGFILGELVCYFIFGFSFSLALQFSRLNIKNAALRKKNDSHSDDSENN